MKIGYNEKMIRKQILSAQEYSRNYPFEKEKQQMPEKKLTFKSIITQLFKMLGG